MYVCDTGRISKDKLKESIDKSNRRFIFHEFWKIKCQLVILVDDETLVEALKEHEGNNYGGQPHMIAIMGNPAYYYFAQYIPTDCAVIDFGCANNSQAYFFDRHRLCIGFEPREMAQFQVPNSRLYRGTAQDFLKEHKEYLGRDDVYAIASCMPDKEVHQLVRNAFPKRIIYSPESMMQEIT